MDLRAHAWVIARWVLGVALVAALIAYVATHPAELQMVKQLELRVLALVLALRIASGLVANYALLASLRIFSPRLKAAELLVVTAGGATANLIAPFGGLPVRAVYFERRHGIKYGELIAVLSVQALARVFASGLVALAGIGWLISARQTPSPFVPAIAAACVLASVIAPLLARAGERFVRPRSLAGGLAAFAGHRRVSAIVVVATLARTILGFAAFGILADRFASFAAGGVMGTLGNVLELVKLTPGNFGIYEGGVALLAEGLGAPATLGVLFAAVFRLLGYGSTAALGAISLLFRSAKEEAA